MAAVREAGLSRRVFSMVRGSPWVMIAVGLHVILAAVMSVAVIRHERKKPATDTQIAVAVARPRPETAVVVPEVELIRDRIPENVRTELVSIEDVATFVPTEDPPAPDWFLEIGDPTGTDDGDGSSSGGTSIGVGEGGRHGTGVPSGLLGRRLGPGSGRVGGGRHPSGRPVATEQAVLEGLRWLVRHQNEDGSWSAETLDEHCTTRTPCIAPDAELDTTFDTGMTALALLAFLGQGITTSSKLEIVDTALGRPPVRAGVVVKKGIRWLLGRQKPDGSFSDAEPFELPENDTLPTMVLCEAYGLAPANKLLEEPAQRALDYLVAAQRRAADGTRRGWGIGSQAELDARLARGELDAEEFAAESASYDLSITCWVVMALKSAQSCGFEVADEVLEGALACAVAATEGGETPHGDGAPAASDTSEHAARASRRAALGMLFRTFAGGAIDDPYLARAARALVANPPAVTKDDPSSVDFYHWYFATLALNQYDGPDSPRAGQGELWEPWDRALVDALLPLQDRSRQRGACARGGWLQEARGNRRGRALYNTALNVLTLEVYYRFANVFGAAVRGR